MVSNRVFSTAFLNSFQMPKHVSVSAFRFFLPHIALALLWPFFPWSIHTVLWCQVTARYLVEERIFSVVLDLPFL